MGAEFTILKRDSLELYDLGKVRVGYPEGMAVPPMPSILQKALRHGARCISAWAEAQTKWSAPGWNALFEIMAMDGNYTVFRLDARPVEELTSLIHMGCQIGTKGEARSIAVDLIDWAAADDLILCCDGEMEGLAPFGFTGEHEDYRRTGDIWNAMSNTKREKT